MATTEPEFFEADDVPPESVTKPRRQQGCLFYGCLISGMLMLLVVIAVGIFTYVAYRSLVQFVEENTATAPRALPKVELPAPERRSLKERVDSFRNAIHEGKPTEPLILTADELNELIAEDPDWKGQVFVSIDGDKLRAQLSVSLERLSDRLEKVGIGMLRGRYFNGEAQLKAAFHEGILNITDLTLEVNGRAVPREIVDALEQMTIDLSRDREFVKKTEGIDSFEIQDGRIIIKARAATPEAQRRVTRPLPDLPENVLAPAGSEGP